VGFALTNMRINAYLNIFKSTRVGGGGEKSFLKGKVQLKGTLSIISSDPQCKDGNARFTTGSP